MPLDAVAIWTNIGIGAGALLFVVVFAGLVVWSMRRARRRRVATSSTTPVTPVTPTVPAEPAEGYLTPEARQQYQSMVLAGQNGPGLGIDIEELRNRFLEETARARQLERKRQDVALLMSAAQKAQQTKDKNAVEAVRLEAERQLAVIAAQAALSVAAPTVPATPTTPATPAGPAVTP